MVFYGYTLHFSLLLKNSCCTRGERIALFISSASLHFYLFSAPPHAADTVYILHYRHRYPVHGAGYASLFLHPSASVTYQLGQSCCAATCLSLQQTGTPLCHASDDSDSPTPW